jgi:glycine hydroxymethyltransferase
MPDLTLAKCDPELFALIELEKKR